MFCWNYTIAHNDLLILLLRCLGLTTENKCNQGLRGQDKSRDQYPHSISISSYGSLLHYLELRILHHNGPSTDIEESSSWHLERQGFSTSRAELDMQGEAPLQAFGEVISTRTNKPIKFPVGTHFNILARSLDNLCLQGIQHLSWLAWLAHLLLNSETCVMTWSPFYMPKIAQPRHIHFVKYMACVIPKQSRYCSHVVL